MKSKLKSDSGYTLVEMIIVIAIIAIMSGAGALTISSIRASQATASMQKFDSELSTLEMRTKTQKAGETIRIVQNGANYDIFYVHVPMEILQHLQLIPQQQIKFWRELQYIMLKTMMQIQRQPLLQIRLLL